MLYGGEMMGFASLSPSYELLEEVSGNDPQRRPPVGGEPRSA
jgi:hypothetical protein